MFDFFKSKGNDGKPVSYPFHSVIPEATVKVKGRTQKEIIQEIHDTFYTEVDRLLAEAKIIKSTETDLQGLIDKSKRLKALGFGNTLECVSAEKEIAQGLMQLYMRMEQKTNFNQQLNILV